MDFKGQKVLITGGCSGIGKIMGRKVLERGAKNLLIADISSEGLTAVKNEFAASGYEVSIYRCDLSVVEQITETAEKIRTEHGTVDVLINNAGIVTGKYFHEHTHGNITKSMQVNAEAFMHLTLELLPGMMAANSGSICNISSAASLISNPKMSVYAASKWAATGWSDSLRIEMEELGKNISVTTVMPFYINTGMFDGVQSRLLPILDPEVASEKIIRAIEKERKMLSMPMPYWFIRLSQGLLPLPAFDWVMRNVFGIYDTMKDFRGRNEGMRE